MTSPSDDFLEPGAEEAALRALNRMGSHKSSSRPAPRPAPSSRPSDSSSSSLRTPHEGSQARKRRFARDGEVPVEHHSLSRTQSRTATLNPAAPTLSGKALEAEKRARADAERQVQELETARRSLTTRLGHTEMLLAELKQTLAARDTELADRTAELAARNADYEACQQELRALRQQLKATPRTEKPKTAREPAVSAEPEPVKWWKD